MFGFERLEDLSPAETDVLVKAGQKMLAAEADERFAYVKILAKAAGARLR